MTVCFSHVICVYWRIFTLFAWKNRINCHLSGCNGIRIHKTNAWPFHQAGLCFKMTELCCDNLPVRSYWHGVLGIRKYDGAYKMCERVHLSQQQLKHITKTFHFHILQKKLRANSQLFLKEGKSLAVVDRSMDKY